MKALEVELGRKPGERWGPRVIDIDIIAYDDVVLTSGRLRCPIRNSSIAPSSCVPLAEIAPERLIAGRRVGEAAASLRAEASDVVTLD